MIQQLILPCPACAALNRVPSDRFGHGNCGRCKGALFTGKPVTLSSQNFDAHASRSDLPLLIDLWAPWCGPCLQMAPAFDAAAAQLEPQLRLGKLDTQSQPDIAARYGIRSIPTLILMSKGREIARQSGAMQAGMIVQWARSAAAGQAA
ncbi:thioredoxin TrxC [Sphingomonas sp. MG17]|uniref:Thioredoxin n=1 Tax=Sphingomonas tagetis TaxID=2949092 RepID=A0A9X2HS18_9SPHN|nr:thioredoxin TrxC [Sphingomonas tagetis]MCP3731540.1 thioredoxin TrxC [Sphingomonas tagetis]